MVKTTIYVGTWTQLEVKSLHIHLRRHHEIEPPCCTAQDEYENPTEEDLNRVYHVPIQPVSGETAETESDRLFQHMTEMTILTVQLIVEFSKHLPGFQTLCREDQVCEPYSLKSQ